MAGMTTIMAAPLQGYTDAAWRHFHSAIYGGIDTYFTPFMRVERGEVRPRDIKGITSSLNGNHNLIPQIIFRDATEFEMLVDAVKEAGSDKVDLNLGCPFPPQVKHGRGAALVTAPDVLKEIREVIASKYPHLSFSAKMRLGVNDSCEWQNAISEINAMPLTHLTVHPRIATQQYVGELDMTQFGELLKATYHPVVYNGDIRTLENILSIGETYPALAGIMIGRGLLARPSLVAEWREGKEWDEAKRIDRLLQFHKLLFEYYSDSLCGDAQILSKIKPFWEYLEEEIGRKPAKAIKKATSVNKYLSAVNGI